MITALRQPSVKQTSHGETMKKILIITRQPDKFTKLADGLSAVKTNDIVWADSVATARPAAFGLVDLIIIDEALDGQSGLSIAKDMIRVNALAHLALVTTLSSEEFHEASEGLGYWPVCHPIQTKRTPSDCWMLCQPCRNAQFLGS